MLGYMEDYLKTSGLSMQFVMLTNIIEEKTELLYVGRGAKNLVHTAFRKECGEHSVVLPGVVSRKKQMVTPLLSAMEEEGTCKAELPCAACRRSSCDAERIPPSCTICAEWGYFAL